MLSNLQLDFEFVCALVIREGAFCSDRVANLIVVFVVINVTPNQLSIPNYAFYIRSALKQEIPLISYLVHFFLLECSATLRLIKNINHGFKQQKKKTLLFLS